MRVALFFICNYCMVVSLMCQNTEAPVYHPIDKSEWEKTVEGMHYDEQQEVVDTKEDQPKKSTQKSISSNTEFLQIIGYVLIAGILIFVLVRLFGNGLFNNNRKTRLRHDQQQYDLDDKPMESDLEKYLREALERNDYKTAVRIYYLLLLKSLYDKHLISWKKNKTNHEYLLEIVTHPEFQRLNNTTNLYEFVWYGDSNIEATEFNSIKNSFTTLIEKITQKV